MTRVVEVFYTNVPPPANLPSRWMADAAGITSKGDQLFVQAADHAGQKMTHPWRIMQKNCRRARALGFASAEGEASRRVLPPPVPIGMKATLVLETFRSPEHGGCDTAQGSRQANS